MITEYEVIRADYLDCGLVEVVILKTLLPPINYVTNPYVRHTSKWYLFRSKCISARKITTQQIILHLPEKIAKRIIEIRHASTSSSIGEHNV